ncbi:hypothetical protein JIR23_24345 [Bradyrhizobium diazoefficiens]|nr:hypothetical protein [Bradyrhizobium diazoefficiens]QQN62669.1 hypothetical protein JIR23_24345 [Bradyrhizobium diazoefficiens]
MAALMAFLQATVADLSEWVHPSKRADAPNHDAAEPMVGKYRANYSPLTPDEIAQDEPELTELHANSRPVSR